MISDVATICSSRTNPSRMGRNNYFLFLQRKVQKSKDQRGDHPADPNSICILGKKDES